MVEDVLVRTGVQEQVNNGVGWHQKAEAIEERIKKPLNQDKMEDSSGSNFELSPCVPSPLDHTLLARRRVRCEWNSSVRRRLRNGSHHIRQST